MRPRSRGTVIGVTGMFLPIINGVLGVRPSEMSRSTPEYHREYRRKNREKINERARQRRSDPNYVHWYKKNPEKEMDQRLQRTYGITLDEYNRMLDSQNGVCAICEEKCKVKSVLSVDHCHETGKVRGLLCNDCNAAIGSLKDDCDRIRRALTYVSNHTCRGIRND